MLLYLVVKSNCFVNGIKRIAAACFLKFLQSSKMLFNTQNELILGNGILAGLTLLIASSEPDEMKTVKVLAISILNQIKSIINYRRVNVQYEFSQNTLINQYLICTLIFQLIDFQ